MNWVKSILLPVNVFVSGVPNPPPSAHQLCWRFQPPPFACELEEGESIFAAIAVFYAGGRILLSASLHSGCYVPDELTPRPRFIQPPLSWPHGRVAGGHAANRLHRRLSAPYFRFSVSSETRPSIDTIEKKGKLGFSNSLIPNCRSTFSELCRQALHTLTGYASKFKIIRHTFPSSSFCSFVIGNAYKVQQQHIESQEQCQSSTDIPILSINKPPSPKQKQKINQTDQTPNETKLHQAVVKEVFKVDLAMERIIYTERILKRNLKLCGCSTPVLLTDDAGTTCTPSIHLYNTKAKGCGSTMLRSRTNKAKTEIVKTIHLNTTTNINDQKDVKTQRKTKKPKQPTHLRAPKRHLQLQDLQNESILENTAAVELPSKGKDQKMTKKPLPLKTPKRH
ncbi:hypothetical protein LXL04_036253 [Taraxacum kok-saghyz]